MNSSLGAALIATLLYRKYARKENDNSYSQSADEFEYLALQILNKFYYTNPQTCIKAIVRSIPAYGNVTCLELAVAAEAKEFIAQRPVQKVLSNIWLVVELISSRYSSQIISRQGTAVLINECQLRPLFSPR